MKDAEGASLIGKISSRFTGDFMGLNEHHADPVALNPVEQSSEAGSALDTISAADSRVVEPIDHSVACGFGEALYGEPLTAFAVPVAADVRCRRSTNISDCLNKISLACQWVSRDVL